MRYDDEFGDVDLIDFKTDSQPDWEPKDYRLLLILCTGSALFVGACLASVFL